MKKYLNKIKCFLGFHKVFRIKLEGKNGEILFEKNTSCIHCRKIIKHNQ